MTSAMYRVIRPLNRALPGRYSPGINLHCLCALLLLALAFQPAGATSGEGKHWCSNFQIPLTQSATQGRVVMQSELIAHMRVSIPIDLVSVTLMGQDKQLPVITSEPQCAHLVVFNQVPPGEYRISSIEGNVNLFMAPHRFLYPQPADGYRVIHDYGRTGLYRVRVPRNLDTTIKVMANQTTYAGQLVTTPDPRRPFAIKVAWNQQPSARRALCQSFLRSYDGSDPELESDCEPAE